MAAPAVSVSIVSENQANQVSFVLQQGGSKPIRVVLLE